jgi:hypothetical protein
MEITTEVAGWLASADTARLTDTLLAPLASNASFTPLRRSSDAPSPRR